MKLLNAKSFLMFMVVSFSVYSWAGYSVCQSQVILEGGRYHNCEITVARSVYDIQTNTIRSNSAYESLNAYVSEHIHNSNECLNYCNITFDFSDQIILCRQPQESKFVIKWRSRGFVEFFPPSVSSNCSQDFE